MVAFAENTYTAACAGDETRVGMKTHTRANRGVQNVWGLDISGSLSGAGGVGGLLASIGGAGSPSTPVFYTFDGNGNVSELVSTNGEILAHYEYSPFGETIVATGELAAENSFRFSTKYFCDEFGMGDWGRRWYSLSMARFANPDPIGEKGGLNLYAFCENQSISSFDMIGLHRLVEGEEIETKYASAGRSTVRSMKESEAYYRLKAMCMVTKLIPGHGWLPPTGEWMAEGLDRARGLTWTAPRQNRSTCLHVFYSPNIVPGSDNGLEQLVDFGATIYHEGQHYVYDRGEPEARRVDAAVKAAYANALNTYVNESSKIECCKRNGKTVFTYKTLLLKYACECGLTITDFFEP